MEAKISTKGILEFKALTLNAKFFKQLPKLDQSETSKDVLIHLEVYGHANYEIGWIIGKLHGQLVKMQIGDFAWNMTAGMNYPTDYNAYLQKLYKDTPQIFIS